MRFLHAVIGTALAIAIGIAIAVTTRVAKAEDNAEGDARPVVVVVEGDARRWTEEIRQAIAGELQTEAVAPDHEKAKAARGILVLSLSTSNGELVIRYTPDQGSEISRRVDAPNEPARIVRTTALLAGNLMRDEASEILAAQKPRSPPPRGSPTSTSPPTTEPVVPAEQRPAARPKLEVRIERPCVARRASAPFHPVVVSLVHPIATNFRSPDTTTPFALNLLYGRQGQIQGADLGIAGMVSCDVEGAQVHAVYARAGGEVRGVQLGGAAVTDETVMGVQGSLVVSKSNRIEGVQLGVVTVARELQGLQMGFANAAEDVTGVQFGFINMARRVKGVQLGIVNIAEDVDGVSLGLVPLVKTGYIRPVAWVSSSRYLNANVGVRFDTRWAYAQTSIGYVEGTSFNETATTVLLGLHLLKPDQKGFLLDIEVGNQTRREAQGADDDKGRAMAHAIAGWRIAKRFALFAGMGAVMSHRASADHSVIGPDVVGGALF